MKLPFRLPILTAAMLSLVGTIHAQAQTTALPPSVSAAPPVWFTPETLQEMTTYLHLGPGTMASAAKILEESYFTRFTTTGDEADMMPKLIYGPRPLSPSRFTK